MLEKDRRSPSRTNPYCSTNKISIQGKPTVKLKESKLEAYKNEIRTLQAEYMNEIKRLQQQLHVQIGLTNKHLAHSQILQTHSEDQ